jgi:hypothetical protein
MSRNNLYNNEDHEIAEQKLWRAVISSTVHEWVHGPLTRQREAERFLFLDEQDYCAVCRSAGIDPGNLRNRLQKFRNSNGSSLLAKISLESPVAA